METNTATEEAKMFTDAAAQLAVQIVELEAQLTGTDADNELQATIARLKQAAAALTAHAKELTDVEVKILNTSWGAVRVHAKGCRDIQKDKTKGVNGVWSAKVSTMDELVLEVAGDIPGDTLGSDADPAEWLALAYEVAAGLEVLPCVGHLH